MAMDRVLELHRKSGRRKPMKRIVILILALLLLAACAA